MIDLQRLDIENALYYVELKSNGHRPLFGEREGFTAFVDILAQLRDNTGSQPVAYCLQQDSIQLVLRNSAEGIASTTQQITQSYTQFAQTQWRHHGSLFHKQVHSLILEPSRYLLPVIQHVHHQPVAMGLVAEASIYPWSSLQAYTGESIQPWLDCHALQQHAGLSLHRRQLHRDYLTQPPSESLNLLRGNHQQVWALASDHFVQRMLQRQVESSQELPPPPLAWIAQFVCDQHRLHLKDLKLSHGQRRLHEIKAEIVFLYLELHSAEQVSLAPADSLPEALYSQLQLIFGDSSLPLEPALLTLKDTRPQHLHTLANKLNERWDNLDEEARKSAIATDPTSSPRPNTHSSMTETINSQAATECAAADTSLASSTDER